MPDQWNKQQYTFGGSTNKALKKKVVKGATAHLKEHKIIGFLPPDPHKGVDIDEDEDKKDRHRHRSGHRR